MQNRKWLRGGADVAVRATFSLAMCSAVAGLLYLTAQNGLADASKTPQPAPRIATVISTLDEKPRPADNASRTATAISSAPVKEVQQVAAATEMPVAVPIKRPQPKQKPVAIAKAGVERFDTCLPNCETRDPMVVGYKKEDSFQPTPIPVADVMMEEPVAVPMTERAGHFLGRALEVPGDAIREGRSLISSVARGTL